MLLKNLETETPKTKCCREIDVKIVVENPEFLPKYQYPGDAAVDLVANIPPDGAGNRRVTLNRSGFATIGTGIRIQMPPGFKAEISARSGLASEKGIFVVNGPAQIDNEFLGEIKVILGNAGRNIVVIEHGDRIAQMYITPIYRFNWQQVDELEETVRGECGLGSTGV